ncbi:ABC transporter permease [Lederbergia lenta]|uniref:Binding-protein-dependent transport systems inner membrane component n=1 Tax=Lederbergia lenta TaxID=1467 RepID=A0A2X4YPZ7_LEDLE|nr:ABC transporter permease [Lederbergia lenta]MEC2325789.1 ABC transporter permease [Lederbergia lenta]SQI53745.1 binding-protein-dependent transport systems inner membrane component [Lederbergia lenta]
MVGIATIIAILIGVPLGIYLTTNEYLAESILRIASIIMTIPSLALFGMMIPILSLIGQGIGFLPALIALVLYSQLPIIRNTYTGIKDVNPNVRDAAKAIGMSTIQRLVKVEIPIAMPLIMTGIRLATVMNIGIGAIAAFIGAGGLGVLINQGISRSNSTMVIVGAVAVSIMAIMADLLLKYIQKRFTVKGINS